MTSQTQSIPPERLAQIASRKLAALGIPHSLQSDRQTLEGMFTFSPGRVVNPVTAVPVGRSRFVAVGHDRLKFLDAPLASLDPVPFYEARTPFDVENPIVTALAVRGEWVKRLAARFEAMKLKVQIDNDSLVVIGLVDTHDCRFEIEGSPTGVRLRRLIEMGKGPVELPENAVVLNLDEFPTGVDLELHLSDRLPQLRAAAMRPQRTATGSSQMRAIMMLEPVRPPPGTPTIDQLARGFGPGALLVPGERLEIAQEFTAGGSHYRFSAQHEAGNTFRAKLMGPRGVHWQDKIDLTRFPGATTFVASVLGVPVAGSDRAESAGGGSGGGAAPKQETVVTQQREAPAPAASSSALWMAHPGEIWVMAVLVERQEGDEVRYACVDVNGRPYGATRVLRRADFERVFVPHGSGWRLLIRIERTEGDTVFYRQLSSDRQPHPEERKLAAAVLTTTFVPEAAAY